MSRSAPRNKNADETESWQPPAAGWGSDTYPIGAITSSPSAVAAMHAQSLLQEQQRYYSERAPEYEQWWHRQGRYDLGPDGNQGWWAEVAEARDGLLSVDWQGQVLELAAGTGLWTEFLVSCGAEVTALDGSAEMLAHNERRMSQLGMRDRVRYQQTNIFAWQPTQRYDAIFFGFWLSHVPAELLDGFLENVISALRPGGLVGFIDSRGPAGNPDTAVRLGGDIEVRKLNSGATARVVKRFYRPEELAGAFGSNGLAMEIYWTHAHFVYGTGFAAPTSYRPLQPRR